MIYCREINVSGIQYILFMVAKEVLPNFYIIRLKQIVTKRSTIRENILSE